MENYVIDIILLIAFIAITVRYFVKGFAKIILDFGAVIVAVIATGAFAGKIGDWLASNTSLFSGGNIYVSKLLTFVFCFAFFFAVFKWAAILINKIFKIPVLKQANKLLGGLLGAVCAVLVISIASVVLQISAHVVYNDNYKALVGNSRIVQLVLSDEKFDNDIFFLN